MTWFGGIACRPIAFRAMESTTTMRVKLVMQMRSDGTTASSVSTRRMTMLRLGLRSSPDFVGSASFATSPRSMLTDASADGDEVDGEEVVGEGTPGGVGTVIVGVTCVGRVAVAGDAPALDPTASQSRVR